MELEAKQSLFIHLTEEAMEEYAFGRLPEGELASFEAHLLHCEHCQERLEAEDNFVEALRVLQRMNESPTRSNPAVRSNPAARPNPAARSNVDTRSNVDARPNADAGSNVVDSPDLSTPIVAAALPAPSGFRAWVLPSATPFTRRGFTPASAAALLAVLFVGMCAWRMPPGRGFADYAKEPAQAVTLTTLRGGAADGIAQARAGQPLDLSINISSLSTSRPEAGVYRLEVVDASGDQCWTGSVVPSNAGQIGARIGTRLDKPLGAGIYWVRLYAPSGKLLREFGLHLD